jgi:hypothetical protein
MERFTLHALMGAAALLSLAPAAHAQEATPAAPAVTPFAMKEAPWYERLRGLIMQNSSESQRAMIFLRALNASGEGECAFGEGAGCHRLAEMILDIGGKAKRDAADFRAYQSTAADVYQRACDLGYNRSCNKAADLHRRLERAP